MRISSIAYGTLVLLLVMGMTVPAAAFPTASGETESTIQQTAIQETDGDVDNVNVSAGQQLSTVVSVTDDDIQSNLEDTSFEATYESSNDTERAQLVAARAARLDERANDIRQDYDATVTAYEEDELSTSEYVQRLATLNARAENVRESVVNLRTRTEEIPSAELEAAGVDRSTFTNPLDAVDPASGSASAMIREHVTGERDGTVRVTRSGGEFEIEFEDEHGNQSRDTRRSRDNDTSITVDEITALETALSELSSEHGEWMLTRASVHEQDGHYKFRFELNGNSTGKAKVRVDGSTGDVFRVREKIDGRERRTGGDDDHHHDDDDARRGNGTNGSAAIDQTEALISARAELSDVDGEWVLSRARVHENDGEYRFRFELADSDASGDARARVDWQSGEVVRFRERVKFPDGTEERTRWGDDHHDDDDSPDDDDSTDDDHHDDDDSVDDDGNEEMSVSMSEARSTARSALSDQDGDWVLVRERTHEDDGEYRFRFELENSDKDGEARVRVDGYTGDVVRHREDVE